MKPLNNTGLIFLRTAFAFSADMWRELLAHILPWKKAGDGWVNPHIQPSMSSSMRSAVSIIRIGIVWNADMSLNVRNILTFEHRWKIIPLMRMGFATNAVIRKKTFALMRI